MLYFQCYTILYFDRLMVYFLPTIQQPIVAAVVCEKTSPQYLLSSPDAADALPLQEDPKIYLDFNIHFSG